MTETVNNNSYQVATPGLIVGRPEFLSPIPTFRPRDDSSGLWDVLELVRFRDAAGTVWTSDVPCESDGASIPRCLWDSVGHPFMGDYVRAAVLHDTYYRRLAAQFNGRTGRMARAAADRMFYEALVCDGVSLWRARVMYLGVRLGGWYTWRAKYRAAHPNG